LPHDEGMTRRGWTPFGLIGEQAEQYHVLVPGVPSWMKAGLIAWQYGHFHQGQNLASARVMRDAERNVRLGWQAPAQGTYVHAQDVHAALIRLHDDQLLRLTDWLLSTHSYEDSTVEELRTILDEGSSKWQVGDREGYLGLIERVPAGVQEAAEQTIASAGTAGRLLATAWANVHRLEPDDSGAYAAAVKAVETASFAALNIVSSDATLGNSIRTIEGDNSYRLPFRREHHKHPTREVLLGMLRTLWRGHRDRHGSEDYSGVTHEEAEAAVTLAVTLVGWFSAGAVQKRSSEDYA
jgi:hypothetical protein